MKHLRFQKLRCYLMVLSSICVVRCAIWYRLYSFKKPANLNECFSRFLNCTKVPNRAEHHIPKVYQPQFLNYIVVSSFSFPFVFHPLHFLFFWLSKAVSQADITIVNNNSFWSFLFEIMIYNRLTSSFKFINTAS